jgi:uncharacterized protein YecT (DUF1311 family)
MRSLPVFLLFYLAPFYSPAQSSVVDVYNAHHFACDSGSGTLETNICSGVKVHFADSLLNRLYKNLLRSIDKEITHHKTTLTKLKTNIKEPNKDDIDFSIKSINYSQRLKQSIITSQRQWIKAKDANLAVVKINCEGGTGCIAITNEACIVEILDRIKKLESF